MSNEARSDAVLTKRQILEQLMERYKASLLGDDDQGNKSFGVTVWQETPSDPNMLLPRDNPDRVPCDAKRTAARVNVEWRGLLFTDVGFATLNTRCGDTWDSAYGIMMAIKKAIAGIAKQIAKGKPVPLIKAWGPRYRHEFRAGLALTEPQAKERSQDE